MCDKRRKKKTQTIWSKKFHALNGNKLDLQRYMHVRRNQSTLNYTHKRKFFAILSSFSWSTSTFYEQITYFPNLKCTYIPVAECKAHQPDLELRHQASTWRHQRETCSSTMNWKLQPLPLLKVHIILSFMFAGLSLTLPSSHSQLALQMLLFAVATFLTLHH